MRERGFTYAPSLRHGRQTNKALDLLPVVPPSHIIRRAGILTCCPSAAAFAIALGPTNPWLIASATETLDLRGLNFSLGLWLLIPTFSLLGAPELLADAPSLQPRMLSYHSYDKS